MNVRNKISNFWFLSTTECDRFFCGKEMNATATKRRKKFYHFLLSPFKNSNLLMMVMVIFISNSIID